MIEGVSPPVVFESANGKAWMGFGSRMTPVIPEW
jgi:hypothetical protein